jgi:hypothetical protein
MLCLQPERPGGFGVDVAIVLVQFFALLFQPLHGPFDRHRNCYRQLAAHESTALVEVRSLWRLKAVLQRGSAP